MQQYFATGLEQLAVFNTGRTNLFAGPATEAAVDMRAEGVGRIFQTAFSYRAHQVKPATGSVVFVTGDYVGWASFEAEAAMDAGEELLFFAGES